MIKFRLHEDIDNAYFSGGEPFHFQREIDYICESQTLSVIADRVAGNITAEPIKVSRKFNDSPESILIIRAGGAGDILFLTPMLRALRARYSKAFICVSCSSRYHWVLKDNHDVDGFCDMPMKHGLLNRYDWIIDLENAVEDCNTKHVVDLFSERADLELSDRRLIYLPSLDAASFEGDFPKTKRRLALQLTASSPVRTYPRTMEIQGKLREAGWEVAIMAEKGVFTISQTIPGLLNVGAMGWNWSKSTDFLRTCDFVIGPDSSMIHFAGAMKIPGIGLYGSFDAKNRLIPGGSIEAIQATRECPLAPCFHHGRRGESLPTEGPCNRSRICNTLATIDSVEIMAKMAKMGF